MGYLLVCVSYVMIGVFGCFGFMGIYFTEYLQQAPEKMKPVAQNCVQMFGSTDILAFLLRLVIMPLVGTAFPLLQHFFRSGILKLMFGQGKGNRANRNEDEGARFVSASHFNIVTAVLLLLPLAIAVFYPQIADILSYVGAVAGIFALYLIPIATYLSKLKLDYENPLLSLADQMNRDFEHKRLYQQKRSKSQPPKPPKHQLEYQELSDIQEAPGQDSKYMMQSSKNMDISSSMDSIKQNNLTVQFVKE